MQHLTTCPHQLVDRFDHVHRNTDGARLVRDRTRDRLTDPPCRIGGEFIAAAIFKLIHRFHQANVPLLNEVKELQTTVGVFLGDRNHETQVRLDHFLLRDPGFFFTLLHLLYDAAEFGNVDTHILADLRHIPAQLFDLFRVAFDEHLPATPGFLRDPLEPGRVELRAPVFLDEFAAVDPRLVGEFHHGAVNRHDPAVDAVKLVDQRFDPVVMQMQGIHQLNDLRPQLLIFRFLSRRERSVLVERCAHPKVLHFRQLGKVAGNPLKRFKNLRFQRSFHRRQRHVGLFVLVIIIVVRGDRVAVCVVFLRLFLGLGRGARFGIEPLGNGLFLVAIHAAAEGRFEVDHVTQENVLGQKFVVPDGNRLEGQRAFAQAQDHRVAPGFDPFGNRDLALTREQLNRAHFAQVHAHRVIGPVELFGLRARNRHIAVPGPDQRATLSIALGRCRLRVFFVLDLFVFDHVDAHLGEHRHHVFDLLRAHLIWWENLIELIVGDVALFTRLRDHLLDRGLAHIEHHVLVLIFGLGVVVVLGGHAALSLSIRGLVTYGGVLGWRLGRTRHIAHLKRISALLRIMSRDSVIRHPNTHISLSNHVPVFASHHCCAAAAL